jgi:hypothetical protein
MQQMSFFRVKVKILYLEGVQMMTFPQKCGVLNETPVRERLKEEIKTLTDRQAEYVLRRMQNERACLAIGSNACQLQCMALDQSVESEKCNRS